MCSVDVAAWYIPDAILFGRTAAISAIRASRYPINTASVMPSTEFSDMPDMNPGQYSLNLVARRQNGRSMAAEVRSLSVLSLRLVSMLIFSFLLNRHAVTEGRMLAILFSSRRMKSIEISARISKSMSVSSFCLVPHVFEKIDYSVTEVSLDGDFPILCTSAHSAFDFQRATQFCKVV